MSAKVKGSATFVRRLEKYRSELGKKRDELRAIRDDADELLESCGDAEDGLDAAIEALSRYA